MKKAILILMVILGWSTIVARLYLRIVESQFSALEATIQFFSFFTVLTNLLVTIYCTYKLFKNPDKKNSSLLDRAETLVALTVFISIVGIVYHIVLKPLWNPDGITMILSEIHHTIIPIGTFLLWLISNDRDQVRPLKLLKWLTYPIIYIVYVLIRGDFSNFYPYPFLDVQTLGLEKVLLNSLGLATVMMVFLMLFYFVGKKLPSKMASSQR